MDPIGGREGGASAEGLKQACEAAGRNFNDITLAYFFAPMDIREIGKNMDLGFSHFIFNLPSESEKTVLPTLDKIVNIIEKIKKLKELIMTPVGYFPCTQDPPDGKNIANLIKELVEQAELCEKVGFDGFYFTEHHQQSDGYLPSPVLLSGMVGMRTTRLKVGTCVLLSPLYHPIRLAEDIAVVDQATEGRMVAAMGIGYQPDDFDAFGVSIKERAARTEESVEIFKNSVERREILLSK